MEEFAFKWPEWIGSPSQFGLLVIVFAAFLRWSLPWRKMSIDEGTQIRKELREELVKVRGEHKVCEDALRSAQKELGVLRDEVNDLENRVAGLRRQHVQEQISLINSIIESVDAPQLKTFLKTLESVQRSLPRIEIEEQRNERISDEGA